MEDHFIKSYDREFSKQNIWLHQRQFFQADGLVWIGSEIVPTDQLVQTEFYELFLSPQAILHSVHAVIHSEDSAIFHLTLTRPPEKSDYSPQEVDCVRIFAAHCLQAMQLHSHVTTQHLIRKGLSELSTHRGVGVAILDSDFQVLHCNEITLDLLEALSGGEAATERSRGHSIGKLHHRCQLPRRIVDRLSSGLLTFPVTLVAEKEEGEYPVIFHIHEIKHFDTFTGSERDAFSVLVVDPETVLPLDTKSISDAYSLTPSEARVSALIAAGERVEDAALQLGITPSTARTHLKRIFEKTRTSRQAELVKLLLDSARRQPITRHFEQTQQPVVRRRSDHQLADVPVTQKRYLTR